MTLLFASNIKRIAQIGLIAKGIVYCLLGLLAFMAAFHINGQSSNETNKSGVFDFIEKQTGGQIILAAIALGLFCYCIWRGIQAYADTEDKGNNAKGWATRCRYLISGLVYGYAAVHAVQLLCSVGAESGNNEQRLAGELLNKPFGQWLVGIAAVLLLAVGIYQIYYGLSEKYRKHVDSGGAANTQLLYAAGKIGYVARGLVWLLIGYMFVKAAISANEKEAGDTSKAFAFLEHSAFGAYLLAAVALGLICYGIFNFIRARYDHFK